MDFNSDTLIAYLQQSSTPKSKRDIARDFGIKGGPERIDMKRLLRDLEHQGILVKQAGGAYSMKGEQPAVTIIEITDIDIDGDVFASPVDTEGAYGDVRIEVKPEKRGHSALKEKDRALASLIKRPDGVYEAKIIRKLDDEKGRLIGLITKSRKGFIFEPANKKIKDEFEIQPSDLGGGEDGDMAVAEIQPTKNLQRKKVRIIEIIGNASDPKAISLLSLHEVGLRTSFPEDVLRASEGLKVPPLGQREDLRKIPLITIDGADARDFDDAVFAEKTDNGYHLIVAIADVSFYVQPDNPLDREAYARGNSTYFPDRVLPMLPEGLSNDLCSLRPKEDRACLAAHLWITPQGKLVRHKFVRALMRSQARCTYEQVQAAHNGQRDQVTDVIYEPVIKPLYEVFKVLEKAREERGALDLDVPERQILIDEEGTMTGVRIRTRLDAHKLIEEFMILANVAAAEALEAKGAPCVYRVHEPPKADRMQSAGEFIEGFGLSLPKAQSLSPHQLNRVLVQASTLPYAHLIHSILLRTQSQARYSEDNKGHYGLALAKYAHFTSPIRRYADLLVHRALVSAYGLGDGGLSEHERVHLEETAQHISECERRSIEAERNSIDRFTAAYLSEHIDAEYSGRISGVTRFGLFVTLNDSGADGIVPIRSLGDDFYVHDEQRHALIGRRTRTLYRLGADVRVRLREADPLTGSTVFELVDHQRGADISSFIEPDRLSRGDRREQKGRTPTQKPYRKDKKTTPKHKMREKKRNRD